MGIPLSRTAWASRHELSLFSRGKKILSQKTSTANLIEALRPAWPPVAILAVAVLAVVLSPPLPPPLAGLRFVAPYTLLVAAL